eukprot:211128-Chlamydomonas_euryale.AAC.4
MRPRGTARAGLSRSQRAPSPRSTRWIGLRVRRARVAPGSAAHAPRAGALGRGRALPPHREVCGGLARMCSVHVQRACAVAARGLQTVGSKPSQLASQRQLLGELAPAATARAARGPARPLRSVRDAPRPATPLRAGPRRRRCFRRQHPPLKDRQETRRAAAGVPPRRQPPRRRGPAD